MAPSGLLARLCHAFLVFIYFKVIFTICRHSCNSRESLVFCLLCHEVFTLIYASRPNCIIVVVVHVNRFSVCYTTV